MKSKNKTQTKIKKISVLIICIILLQIFAPVIGNLNFIIVQYAAEKEAVTETHTFDINNVRYTLIINKYATAPETSIVEAKVINKNVESLEIQEFIQYGGKSYSVKTLDENMAELRNLKKITVPKTIIDSFVDNGKHFFNYFTDKLEELTVIGEGTFPNYDLKRCKSLKKVTLKNSTKGSFTKIGDSAFFQCPNLEDVMLPDKTVTEVGNSAFLGCKKLVGIYDYKNTTSSVNGEIVSSLGYYQFQIIDDWAFYNCQNLVCLRLDMYSSEQGKYPLQKIGMSAFKDCSKFGSYICGYITEIGDEAFRGTCVGSLKIMGKDTQTTIGKNAFNSTDISSVNIESKITEIKDGTFAYCKKLQIVNLPDGLKKIGDKAFYESGTIYNDIHMNNYKPEFKIPRTVTSIGSQSFSGGLAYNIRFYSSIKDIAKDAIVNYTGKITCSTYSAIDYYLNRKDIDHEVEEETIEINKINYLLYSDPDEGYLAMVKEYNGSSKNVTIPASIVDNYGISYRVCDIGTNAFENNDNLISVNLPGSIYTIEPDAFSYCEYLKEIKIPISVTSIISTVFYNSPNVTIIGVKGSFAEEYAKEYDIKFQPIGTFVDTKQDTKAVETKKVEKSTVKKNTNNIKTIKSTTNEDTTSSNANVQTNGNQNGVPVIKNVNITPKNGSSKTVKISWTATFSRGKGPDYWTITGSDKKNYYNSVRVTQNQEIELYSNGTYYLKVFDKNRKYASYTFNIGTIDKTCPTIENLTYSIKNSASHTSTISWTARDTGVGIVEWKVSKNKNEWENNFTKYKSNHSSIRQTAEVKEDGTYYVYAKDDNDNCTWQSIIVDTTCPNIEELTVEPSNGTAAKSVTVSWKATDNLSGVKEWKLAEDAGSWTDGYKTYRDDKDKPSATINKNGTYYLYIRDNVGNATCRKIEVTNIDESCPLIMNVKKTKVKNSVLLSFSAVDNGLGVRYWKISTKEKDWNGGYTDLKKNYNSVYLWKFIDKSGLYYIYVKDEKGNARYVTANVDVESPEITYTTVKVENGIAKIQYNAQDSYSGIKSYKISTKSDGSDGTYYCYNKNRTPVSNTGVQYVQVKASGTYYLVVKDAEGNVTISNPILVDLNKPYISSLKQISNTGKTISKVNYLKNESKVTYRITFSEDISNVDTSKAKLAGKAASKCKLDLVKVDDKTYDIVVTGGTEDGEVKIVISEGFLTDIAGNKSAKSGIDTKVSIRVDNTAPVAETTYINNVVSTKIIDETRIKNYQWRVIEGNSNNILWKGNMHKNVNKIKVTQSWKLNRYKGKTVQLYVEDILGNQKLYTIRPEANATVNYVESDGNKKKYEITMSSEANIDYSKFYRFKDSTSKDSIKAVVLDKKAGDTTNKKFVLTVECSKEENKTIALPKGTIYMTATDADDELEISVDVCNVKPTIEFGEYPTAIVKTFDLPYTLKSSVGIKKYEFTRSGKLITTNTINTEGDYEGSLKKIIRNGVITLKVWDNQGNISEKDINITNIDRTAPKATVTYGVPDANSKVLVTIEADEKITASGWTNVTDAKITKTYNESTLTGTGNKATITIADVAGNTAKVILKDEIAPRVKEISKTELSNGKIKVEIEFTEKIKATQYLSNIEWTLSEDQLKLSKDISYSESIIVEDLAGNQIEDAINIEKESGSTQVGKIFKTAIRTPTKNATPAEQVSRKLLLNRPIQRVDLGGLEGKVRCEILDNNTTVNLTFEANTDANYVIKFVENENYSEDFTIAKVTNVVKKGDANLNGKIDAEDLQIIKNHILEKEIQTETFVLFALDVNGDGVIDIEDQKIVAEIIAE